MISWEPGKPAGTKTATISPCGQYRYDLSRTLDDASPASILLVVGLNPSTADAHKNDNTISKEIGFARRWHMSVLAKVNTEAFRTTFPRDLKAARKRRFDTVGPDNDETIREWLRWVNHRRGSKLVAAWGTNVDPARQVELAYLFDEAEVVPWCLGTNLDGSPVHPLYIPYERELVRWQCP